jgi:hypothetical protein
MIGQKGKENNMHNFKDAEKLLQNAYDGELKQTDIRTAVEDTGAMALHLVFDSMLIPLSDAIRENPHGQLAMVMMEVAHLRGSEDNSDHDQLFFERRYGISDEF